MTYEFEDVACNVLKIDPLTSRTWTVEIRPGDPQYHDAVIMTREDLLAMAHAIAMALT